MSQYQPREGQGSLFRNKHKQNDKAPSYRGYFILPNGEVVGLALWSVDTRDGDKILSLKVDDRESEYHAKKLGRVAATVAATEAKPAQRRPMDGATDAERIGFPQKGGRTYDPKDEFDDDLPF